MRLKADDCAAVVLAAGQGTRMKSRLPKVLHRVAGRPMIHHVLEAVAALGPAKVVAVVGHEAEQVRAVLGPDLDLVEQAQQLGTGHAVLQTRPLLEGKVKHVLVTYGDMPLLQSGTLQRLVNHHLEKAGCITILTCLADDPTGYGRVLRNGRGRVLQVVEEAEASPEQRAIAEVNAGVGCYAADWLWPHLSQIRLNARGEYYLTDLPEMAAAESLSVETVSIDNMAEVAGINDRVQLAEAEAVLRERVRERLMLSGVTIIDPRSTFIDTSVWVGSDTVIYPNTFLEGSTVIGPGCEVGPFSRLVNSRLGEGAKVVASFLEEAEVGDRASVGPFSHLRPGTRLAADVYVGNFAEMKNSTVDSGSHVHHFSYLGDATLGRDVNIGAGTITCNFSSETQVKSRTTVEDGAAIGSDTMLVAPVKVGKGAITGSGSVVTRDVPPETVAYGVPAREVRPVRKRSRS